MNSLSRTALSMIVRSARIAAEYAAAPPSPAPVSMGRASHDPIPDECHFLGRDSFLSLCLPGFPIFDLRALTGAALNTFFEEVRTATFFGFSLWAATARSVLTGFFKGNFGGEGRGF